MQQVILTLMLLGQTIVMFLHPGRKCQIVYQRFRRLEMYQVQLLPSSIQEAEATNEEASQLASAIVIFQYVYEEYMSYDVI